MSDDLKKLTNLCTFSYDLGMTHSSMRGACLSSHRRPVSRRFWGVPDKIVYKLTI